jgi:hypothetical protein
MGNVSLGDEIINEAGVCQTCFLKFNEYDEHLTNAEQIQQELLALMENKQTLSEEEHLDEHSRVESITTFKEEEELSTDVIEYEPYDAHETQEELYLEHGEETELTEGTVIETLGEDCHFEIVVDDTKENRQKKPFMVSKSKFKHEQPEFQIIETDDHQKMYQCDVCLKMFKDKSKLRSHREIHTNERNVICPVRSRLLVLNIYLTNPF